MYHGGVWGGGEVGSEGSELPLVAIGGLELNLIIGFIYYHTVQASAAAQDEKKDGACSNQWFGTPPPRLLVPLVGMRAQVCVCVNESLSKTSSVEGGIRL